MNRMEELSKGHMLNLSKGRGSTDWMDRKKFMLECCFLN